MRAKIVATSTYNVAHSIHCKPTSAIIKHYLFNIINNLILTFNFSNCDGDKW